MESDLELICDYYLRLERQGPGSPEITRKALRFVNGLNDSSQIADIGCGSGGQTLELAQHVSGSILGIDMLRPFVDQLQKNAAKLGLQGRITAQTGPMERLLFEDEGLDLIWSEGAIYNMGFEKGLKAWKQFLKPGGYIAVSEISWFTDDRPAELDEFWMAAYPEIATQSGNVATMQRAGYEVIASFKLPENCWIENYYAPQEKIMEDFLKAHPGNAAAESLVAEQREEADLYRRFKEFYGYAFYIGKKV